MTLIIAEAGVNHNGDDDLAFQLVDEAYKAGADIVKFQTFKSNKLVTSEAGQAAYQKMNTGREESQLNMLSRLELSHDSHHRIVEYCSKVGIEFLSTAFDSESLSFLVNDLKLKRLKIASGELSNAPLLLEHARTGCDLIVSTGMATLSDIELALGVIAFGYTSSEDSSPSIEAFSRAYSSCEGQNALRNKVTLLHCTTEYPAPLAEVNLRAMDTLGNAFGLPCGYSDHTSGYSISIAAAARGAVIVEKHFTLSRQLEGPDHEASLEPKELALMVSGIRDLELALGDGIKRPTFSEINNKQVAQKSLVAEKNITKGELFTEDNISVKRPGSGKSPYLYWSILDTPATRAFSAGELIDD
ncbi:N-acetylneuraminate synthase [Gammaproteobacteria bacterium]|nr:N-acetylneuraminate synthase [Gammaproteobacteria bacterium]